MLEIAKRITEVCMRINFEHFPKQLPYKTKEFGKEVKTYPITVNFETVCRFYVKVGFFRDCCKNAFFKEILMHLLRRREGKIAFLPNAFVQDCGSVLGSYHKLSVLNLTRFQKIKSLGNQILKKNLFYITMNRTVSLYRIYSIPL